MGIGTGSVPLRSPHACIVRAIACFRAVHGFCYGRVHVLTGHGRRCDESLCLPLRKGRVFDIRVIDVAGMRLPRSQLGSHHFVQLRSAG